jgi:hypothetical protein
MLLLSCIFSAPDSFRLPDALLTYAARIQQTCRECFVGFAVNVHLTLHCVSMLCKATLLTLCGLTLPSCHTQADLECGHCALAAQ